MPIVTLAASGMNAALGDHSLAPPGHVDLVKGMIPINGTYRLQPQPEYGFGATVSGGLPPTGMYVHVFPSGGGTATYTGDGATVLFGTKSNLFTATSAAFADVSRVGGYATVAGQEPSGWRFASFGNDVWAANYVDELQVRANNSGTFANGVTSVFKPRGRFIAPARSYMTVADLANGGYYADGYAWSVPGNAANYDAAASGGGGTARILSAPGGITGWVGGEFIRAFKRSSLHVLSYTGDVLNPWREDLVSGSVGTPFSRSVVVGPGDIVYFYSGDSFYRQVGMQPPEKIGGNLGTLLCDPQVENGDYAVRSLTYPTTMSTEDGYFCSARLARSGVVLWGYRAESNVNPEWGFDKLLAYEPDSGLWSFPSTDSMAGLAQFSSYPAFTENSMYSGFVGLDHLWAGSREINWFRWDSAPFEQAEIRWGWNPISLDQQNKPVKVRVRGSMPVFTWRTPGLSPNTRPTNVTVRIEVCNDPYLDIVLGGDGNSVQPQQEDYEVSVSEDAKGWLPHNMTGCWIRPTVFFGQGSKIVQNVAAIMLDVEIV